MKFQIESTKLVCVLEGNESPEELAFVERLNKYDLTVNGASVSVFEKESTKVIAYINSFDNTILIHEPEGIQLARGFGGKRFIINAARENLDVAAAGATQFHRDRSFPISYDGVKDRPEMKYEIMDWDELQNLYRTDRYKIYENLTSLFNRCADFTPKKQEEYVIGMEDKYCRFNSGNQHLFLVDNNQKIVGTISATIQGYIYDEVVDYFTLLSPEAKEEVLAKAALLRNESDEAKKEAIKKEMAELIEPSRNVLLAQLFEAARQRFVGLGNNASIRVADGRQKAYEDLGCSEKNTNIFVIHDPRPENKTKEDLKKITSLTETMLAWAAEQLETIKPKLGTASHFAPAPQTSATAKEEAQAAAKKIY